MLVTTESRFDRTPDGACWNVGWASYGFWQRYLDVFEHVGVVARVRDIPYALPGAVRVDGPNVSVVPLPYYVGPWAYLRKYLSLRRATRAAFRKGDAIIARGPGIAANLIVSGCLETGRPFGIEVLGDPYDVFSRGGVRSALRPLLQLLTPRTLRRQCATACAVAYVTAGALQQRYPALSATYVTRYSSIDLPDEAFVPQPRQPRTTTKEPNILFVGSLEQMYKAPDVLIDAVALVVKTGLDLRLTVIGDGKHRRELEARVAAHHLTPRVRFLGHLPPGAAIREQLDAADLCVLPSRTEGLPRVLIEAMARAVPCVGSDIGGIRELLSAPERVSAGDTKALADKLVEVLRDPERLARLSAENLRRAEEYHASVLRPRRQAFYRAVREATLEQVT